jgi:hypothetical protein
MHRSLTLLWKGKLVLKLHEGWPPKLVTWLFLLEGVEGLRQSAIYELMNGCWRQATGGYQRGLQVLKVKKVNYVGLKEKLH